MDLVGGLGAGLHGAAANHSDQPDRLHHPDGRLGCAGGLARQHRPGGCFGIGVVGLAAPPRLAVGPVDLHHPDTFAGEVAGQAGAPRAGALHADGFDVAEAAQPTPHSPVAASGGRELLGAQYPAAPVDSGGDMKVLVGVHPARDRTRRICHGGHCHPFLLRWVVDGTHGRDDGQDSDGAPATSSY